MDGAILTAEDRKLKIRKKLGSVCLSRYIYKTIYIIGLLPWSSHYTFENTI